MAIPHNYQLIVYLGKTSTYEGFSSCPSAVRELHQVLSESYASVRQCLHQAHFHWKQLRGHSGHPGEFQCGDRVWLYVPVVKRGQSKKLTSFWQGTYTVVDKTSAVNYCIRLIGTSRSLVVHNNRFKLCYESLINTKGFQYEYRVHPTTGMLVKLRLMTKLKHLTVH